MNCKAIFNSIRFKMIVIFLCFSIPLVLLLIIINGYAIDVVRNQVAQSNKNLVTLYMEQIDHSLGEVDKYLYTQAAQNIDLLSMDLSDTDNSQRYYKAKLRLSNTITSDINNYKSIDMFFVYSSVNMDLLTTPVMSISYEERDTVRENIKQLLQGHGGGEYQIDRWYIHCIDESYYLYHYVKVNGVYIGAWVNVENLMIPLNLVDLGQMGKAILVTGDNEPMSNASFIYENNINLKYGKELYNLTGGGEKFLVVGEGAKKGDFSLVAIIPNSVILEKLPYIQKIVSSLLPIVSILFLLLYLIFLRKIILLPVSNIVRAMEKIHSGDLDVRIEKYVACNEFNLMNETFNSMVKQIHDLKIQVYEEKISKQRAELRHLQLQIKPHFFLNSLNIIYQLAQVKNYKLIKEMSVSLVEYFRFMFRSNLTFVLLEDEIKHTQNYLRIQKMRFNDFLDYSISLPDALIKYLIPPLLIQTFVENSIKHAVTMDIPVHIYINVELDGTMEKPEVKISIYDTGKGFSDDILINLQSENDFIGNDPEKHIGIWNVRQRLRLLYKDQAEIEFSNMPENGACVVIRLPLKTG